MGSVPGQQEDEILEVSQGEVAACAVVQLRAHHVEDIEAVEDEVLVPRDRLGGLVTWLLSDDGVPLDAVVGRIYSFRSPAFGILL